jgi:hypothetical protein
MSSSSSDRAADQSLRFLEIERGFVTTTGEFPNVTARELVADSVARILEQREGGSPEVQGPVVVYADMSDRTNGRMYMTESAYRLLMEGVGGGTMTRRTDLREEDIPADATRVV